MGFGGCFFVVGLVVVFFPQKKTPKTLETKKSKEEISLMNVF